MGETPFLSVITPSYNQKESIRWMLQAWQAQIGRIPPFELIISDDGSSDETGQMVEDERQFFSYPITFIPHKDEGFRVARAKNDAIRAAKGDYILVMDGDTFPGKDTVTAFLPHLDPETVLHAKRWRVDPIVLNTPFSWEVLEKNKTRGEWRAEKLPDLPPGNWNLFSGANCIIPAKLSKEFLWAPDDWDGFGYDDYYFAVRWIASGRNIRFVDSVAWHLEHPNTAGDPRTGARLQEKVKELKPQLERRGV